jgi:hypothetical protein
MVAIINDGDVVIYHKFVHIPPLRRWGLIPLLLIIERPSDSLLVKGIEKK